MKLIVRILCLLSFFNFAISNSDLSKFIVITDLEPDDRIALHILCSTIEQRQLLFVGTTVMHAARKKVLAKRLLDQLGFNQIPVFQGTGNKAENYPDISSSRAAREYTNEGRNILAEEELDKLNAIEPSSSELQENIEKALKENNNIELIVLAPPTDLVAVLKRNPDLKKNIKHIYVMGGWTELLNNSGQAVTLRTSYNWNMDPISSADLMKITDIPMTLYSSHIIKRFFHGGSINFENFPEIINCLDKLKKQLPSLIDQEIASLSWDNHIINTIPALSNIIEPFKGNQFTPADPLVICGIFNKNIIKKAIRINVHIDVNDKDSSNGFRVYVEPNINSNIELVDSINIKAFEKELLESFESLNLRLNN